MLTEYRIKTKFLSTKYIFLWTIQKIVKARFFSPYKKVKWKTFIWDLVCWNWLRSFWNIRLWIFFRAGCAKMFFFCKKKNEKKLRAHKNALQIPNECIKSFHSSYEPHMYDLFPFILVILLHIVILILFLNLILSQIHW